MSLRDYLGKPVLAASAIGLLVFLTLVVIRYSGLLQSTELAAYDLVIRLKPASVSEQGRIVVLGIKETDIQKLGTWPLTDAVLVNLLERLAALGPEVVGVDMYRDTAVPPGTDELARLLKKNDNVIFVEKFGETSAVSVSPPAVLQGTDQIGFSDLPVDFDGVVRKGLLFLDSGDEVQYSFALRLALKYLQEHGVYPEPGEPDPGFLRLGPTTIKPFEPNDGGYIGADAAGYQFMLGFSEGPYPFKVFSLTDLLSGHITAGDIKNKIVLIGVVADSVKDYFATPHRQEAGLASGMPGVVLHAHAVSQLLNFALDGEKQLRVLKEWQEYSWMFIWVLAGVAAGLWVRSLVWLSIVLALGPAVLVATTYGSFMAGWWVPPVPAILSWLASGALVTAYISGHEKAQRRLVMDLFSRHVSPDVAQELWKQRDKFSADGRLETKKITATVLFSDLENFTPISEMLDPVELMNWLNQYMDAMAGIVMEYGGFVDDYYGDAIKANFGVPMGSNTPEGIAGDALNAAQCALAMRTEMDLLNGRWALQGLPQVHLRVGICTGPVVSGCLGSSRRMKYTTIGDTVNTAARLESYGKSPDTAGEDDGYCRILLSESTAVLLKETFKLEPVGSISLKGKTHPLKVFRIENSSPEPGKSVQEGMS